MEAYPVITRDKMYVNGQWQTPAGSGVAEIVNPATEEVVAKVSLGNEADIDLAVQAARAAFDSWSQTPAAERAVFLDKIVAGLEARTDDLADAITSEMGIPVMLCKGAQIGNPLFTFKEAAELARNYEFETDHGSTHVVREAAGVCGLITPWNFPLNQIGGKLAPALAAVNVPSVSAAIS